MTLDLNTLIGFLSGSFLTLIVKELINQFNKKQDFKRDIFKITYSRKLEIAEKAIAFYWTYLNQIISLKSSFQVLIQIIKEIEVKDNDFEVIQGVLEQNSKTLSELSGEKYFDVNSVHLYFNLEDKDKWNDKDNDLFVKSLAEIGAIDNDIQILLSLHNNHLINQENQQADFFWNKAMKLLPTYINLLEKVIFILEKNKVASNDMILKLKNQLV